MANLYVCEYPYVLYKTLIKVIGNRIGMDDVIISNRLPEMENIIPIIRKSKLFRNVYVFNSKSYTSYYKNVFPKCSGNMLYYRLTGLKRFLTIVFSQRKYKRILDNIDIDFKQYEEIYCTDLPHIINAYLANNKIPFIIIEHARDIFKENNYNLIINLMYLGVELLDRLKLVVGIRTTTKYCKGIEINSYGDMALYCRHKNLIIWNVDEAITRLSQKQKEVIYCIYAKAYGLELDYNKEYNVLLTNPLCNDAFVSTEEG